MLSFHSHCARSRKYEYFRFCHANHIGSVRFLYSDGFRCQSLRRQRLIFLWRWGRGWKDMARHQLPVFFNLMDSHKSGYLYCHSHMQSGNRLGSFRSSG